MCQLNAYLVRSGQEELVAEDVVRVQVDDGGKVFLTTLFEQCETIDARIQVVDLVHNKLLLGPSDAEEPKE